VAGGKAGGAAVKKVDRVGQIGRFLDGMGDEDDRGSMFALGFQEIVLEGLPADRVEAGKGFVQEQKIAIRCQGPGYGHPLAHAARESRGEKTHKGR
jgi:hypothetical protein